MKYLIALGLLIAFIADLWIWYITCLTVVLVMNKYDEWLEK